MGLDTVELVIAVEEEFGIDIPNSDASSLAILGDMHRYVLDALRRRGEVPNEDEVWDRLSRVIVEQLGVRPEQVQLTAHIVTDLGVD